MKNTAKQAAPTCARSGASGLTLPQQNAVDLLASGKNDTETAAALDLHRVTVTRWRLYSPTFRAALATERASIWGASADRLRALLPKALDTIAEALESADEPRRVSVALAVLKHAGALPLTPTEPDDPEEVLRRMVEAERERGRNDDEARLDFIDGLPEYKDHLKSMRKRLTRLAEADGS